MFKMNANWWLEKEPAGFINSFFFFFCCFIYRKRILTHSYFVFPQFDILEDGWFQLLMCFYKDYLDIRRDRFLKLKDFNGTMDFNAFSVNRQRSICRLRLQNFLEKPFQTYFSILKTLREHKKSVNIRFLVFSYFPLLSVNVFTWHQTYV